MQLGIRYNQCMFSQIIGLAFLFRNTDVYMQLPNNKGMLDVTHSMTRMIWLRPTSTNKGPLLFSENIKFWYQNGVVGVSLYKCMYKMYNYIHAYMYIYIYYIYIFHFPFGTIQYIFN